MRKRDNGRARLWPASSRAIPANELARLERHGSVAVRAFEAVVLVFERDAVRVGGDQAAVGDGDAMGVAAEVGQHLLWPGEGTLGIDEPVRLPQRAEVGLEGCCVGEMLIITEELEVACGVRRSSPSIVRGSRVRGWRHAKRGRSRGRYPRLPERGAA